MSVKKWEQARIVTGRGFGPWASLATYAAAAESMNAVLLVRSVVECDCTGLILPRKTIGIHERSAGFYTL